MPPSAARLYEHLCRNYPEGSYHSAYEAGFCGFTPHYELTALGIDNIVFNPADINDSQKERVRKCDIVDCSKICRNLEQGNLKAYMNRHGSDRPTYPAYFKLFTAMSLLQH